MVGSWGRNGERAALDTANPRSLPNLTFGNTEVIESNIVGNSPLIT